MNMTSTSPFTPERAEAAQALFARRLAARLDQVVTQQTAPDIEERLRFAREQAVLRARQARAAAAKPVAAPAVVVTHNGKGAAALGGGSPWWMRMAAALPLVLLIGGLTLIQERQYQQQIETAADIDTALLTDNLPPDAYKDPGFAEFLRRPQE